MSWTDANTRIRCSFPDTVTRVCLFQVSFWLLALLVLSETLLHAQSGAEIIFKASTDLVLVPAVVTRNSEPVRGLQLKDFTVRSGGKTQTVRVFQEIEAPNPASFVPPVSESVRRDQVAINQDTIIVVVDLLNARNTSRLRRFTVDVLQQFAAIDLPVSVLVSGKNGLVELHQLTSSNEHLKTLLRLLTHEPIDAAMAGQNAGFSPDTLAALRDLSGSDAPRHDLELVRRVDFAATTLLTTEKILRMYGALPGRKKLIWIAQQVPRYLAPLAVTNSQQTALDYYAGEFQRATRQGPIDGDEVFPASGTESELQTARLRHELLVWKRLNDQNFRVMPIIDEVPEIDGMPRVPQLFNNRALVPDPCQESRDYFGARLIDSRAPDVCYNDPSGCARRAVQDRHYYMLGFYLGGNIKPGIYKLHVSVADKSVKVSSRVGFAVFSRRDQTVR